MAINSTTSGGGMPYNPLTMRQNDLYDAINRNGGRADRSTQGKLFGNQFLQDMLPGEIMRRQQQGANAIFADPRISAARAGTEGAMNNFAQGYGDQLRNMAMGKGAIMGQMRNQAMGRGPSMADAYGRAQRQNRSKDIATQLAAMPGGSSNPAMQYAALGQQGSPDMYAQIAANRVAERQQAQQNYMNARMGAMGQALGMDAQNFDNRFRYGQQTGDFYGAGAGLGNQATELGGNFVSNTMADKFKPF